MSAPYAKIAAGLSIDESARLYELSVMFPNIEIPRSKHDCIGNAKANMQFYRLIEDEWENGFSSQIDVYDDNIDINGEVYYQKEEVPREQIICEDDWEHDLNSQFEEFNKIGNSCAEVYNQKREEKLNESSNQSSSSFLKTALGVGAAAVLLASIFQHR